MGLTRRSLALAAAVVTAAAGGSVAVVTSTGEDPGSPPARSTALGISLEDLTASRPSLGPRDAPVTVVEFSSYVCEYCARHVADVYPKLREKYGDRLRYVVVHFPRADDEISMRVAQAASCADEQGRFWQTRGRLFLHSQQLNQQVVRRELKAAGVDLGAFDRCIASGRPAGRLMEDLSLARRLRLPGAPSFVVGDIVIAGAKPLSVFDEAITRALAAHNEPPR